MKQSAVGRMTFCVSASSEGTATTANVREHQVVIDADATMGGKGMGPNPMEAMLLALAACENITASMVAREIDFDLQSMNFDVTAELDPRGVMGDSAVRTYFDKVHIRVILKTSESDDRIRLLQQAVEQRCPAYRMFRAAGVEVMDEWSRG